MKPNTYIASHLGSICWQLFFESSCSEDNKHQLKMFSNLGKSPYEEVRFK